MPTYRYRFEDGTEEEFVQSIHDEPFTWHYHPETGVPGPVRRVIQKPTVVLKGEGWATKS